MGCPIGHQAPPVRAQEAANELNVNTRFGRMEMAAEHVSAPEREKFLARRKAWGGGIRVADYELAGLRMRGDEDAETLVKIAWYRMDEGDLRTTTLRQTWHVLKGDWKLVDEARADGDIGLLGEPLPAAKPDTAGPRRAQFPTIHLGAAPPEGAPATIPPPEE